MDVAREFGQVIGPLRRAVLRTRLVEDLPDLPEAQIEVLRALQRSGAATPGELALHLRVARSTISNLIRTMTASGLIRRTPSSSDLRVVELSLTPRSHDLLERYDRVSTAALQRALDSLTHRERSALARALPAMRALLSAVDAAQPGRRADPIHLVEEAL